MQYGYGGISDWWIIRGGKRETLSVMYNIGGYCLAIYIKRWEWVEILINYKLAKKGEGGYQVQ